MPNLQKLRSSRSEEKLPSSHGNKKFKDNAKALRSLTDYEYNSFDDMDSIKDDDNDVLFTRKYL